MGQPQTAIGIDVGGTGIKGAAVDTRTGETLTDRHRVPTPAGGRPDDVAREVGAMVSAIRAEARRRGIAVPDDAVPVGVTLPGVVRDGVMRTAANVDPDWIGTDAVALLSEAVGSRCLVVNDADAAGIAETAFGEVRGMPGVTMVLTFGTGIGSALVCEGVLVPNFELGHLELHGHPVIERYTSAKVIEREGISLEEWAARAARYLAHLEKVMNPDRFVIGGSISKASDQYLPFPGVTAPVVPASFRNNAGIVGAARLAYEAARCGYPASTGA
ncbi:polyphosphate--glucose phosphotransferase [Leucobacter sp. wl10]|uniref:polyphosphate--glucose phosphotransferase n=1 Tax=Leucobacter sp. wl10 TaxID=2304677 RepID=UPI000E5B58C9|nr:ROK family protein [Leucobacter sp. wl10]RGE19291.1 ROK family protein [Leucobacter sp. wl10]